MKIPDKVTSDRWQVTRTGKTENPVTCHLSRVTCRGFTMVEIAICLAIIGFALVAIIGVLPIGMSTQRENREETIINQDATVFIEAIRNGSRGLDDLTNYVYAITNFGGQYNNGVLTLFSPPPPIGYANGPGLLTNGMNIVGLLSMPEFTDPTNNYAAIDDPSSFGTFNSNYIVAYVRSISGPAVEKPPQILAASSLPIPSATTSCASMRPWRWIQIYSTCRPITRFTFTTSN